MFAIIQARSSSKRLPNKVNNIFVHQPMILWTYERLKKTNNITDIVVATSEEPSDDRLYDLLSLHKIGCFRGDLNNVAKRYLAILDKYECEAFVRISGDSPLIDPQLVDRVVDQYIEKDADISCNIYPRSFPKGQSVEVINATTFKKAVPLFITEDHREHVTSYFYENASDFRITNLSHTAQMNHLQLSVDTPEDHSRLEALVKRVGVDNLSLETMISDYSEV